MKTRCRVFVFCLFMLLLVFAASGCGGTEHRAAAVANVNDQEITEDELQEFMNAVFLYMPDVEEMYSEQEALEMLENEILWFLIENRVLEQEVLTLGLEVDEERIEDIYQETREELINHIYGTEEDFYDRLEELEVQEDSLRMVHRDTFLRELLFEHAGSSLPEEEVRAFVEENPALLAQPAQVYALHILVETEEEAESVLDRLEAGEDFMELGQEVSLDSHVDLGYISSDDMLDPTFLEAAFDLSAEEISDPVETVFGHHIIKITDKQDAQELSFEEVAEEAREIKKRLYFEEYLQTLMSEAAVETFLGQ